MEEIVAPQDRAALLRQGIAVVDAEYENGRLHVEVTGRPDERVLDAVKERFGPATAVSIVDDLPRRLYARPCVGQMEREEKRLQLRYVHWPDEHVDDILVVEDDESVVVFGMMCVSAGIKPGDACESPYHVYLDRPLGGRTVYCGVSGEPVPYKNVWIKIQEEIDRGEWAETRSTNGG
jgi:hypothetical protein